ncbi:MAG: CRTAC1 family protein [Gemmatimonadota bacterium]|nr:CRTAC1 family protein [Gemmatimonadota bacterium]MDH3479054.1 CRTAC1 family protein [Gemmatimonadota bacterium]MDH3570399.1 CRTAC1 family protein [Gemmatimonadota bacterium]
MRSSPSATSEGRAAATPRRVIRIVAIIAFFALLATPLVIRHFSSASQVADAGLSVPAALERYGFALQEVSDAAGIRFTHQPPVLDPKLEPIMPAVAAYGAAVSVMDFDRDGWQDLYVTNSAVGGRNALYRNRGDGTFEDVAARLGVADVNRRATGVSMGAVWGDYDNDGYEDLFLYRWGHPELFRNDGGRGFSRVTERVELPAWINANTAVWFDYDRDGWLDLFVGAFYPADVDLWNLPHTRIMPESFEYAQNGGRNYLLRNRGDGSFEEVADGAGLITRRWTLAAATADVDGDGDPDLFVANDYGINELYLNDGGQRFREIGRAANVARTPKSGMNASFGDVFNRGEWILYVSNISEPGVLIHGNDLWVPTHVPGENPSYRNLAGAMGVELAGFAFGAQFGDLNNDGWLDLFVTNGYVSGETRESYWYDYSMVAGGYRNIIADAGNWPAMRGRSLSGYQEDRVWLNDGAGRFQDVTRAVGSVNANDGRAVAFADLWNRGALDAIVANQRGPLLVYRNTVTPTHGWIAFTLEGTRSNRSAIGAEIRLYRAGMEQLRQIEGGNGFAAQNQRRAHFGLGAASQVDSVVIRWPSGIVQTIPTPAINTLHAIREPK